MNIDLISCPACGDYNSESTKLKIKPSGRSETTFFKCYNCGSYFNPNFSSLNEEIVHTKLTSWGAEDSGKKLSIYKSLMYDTILNLLSRYKPPPASLIDVGCSYAGFITHAHKKNYTVYGLDILTSAVDFSKSLGFNVVQASSISEVKFNIPAFDVVSILDANCYFNNQPLELSHVHSKLVDKGILVMRVVDKSFFFSVGLLVSKLLPGIGRRIAEKSVNDHRFSMPIASLLKLLTSNGFEILYSSPKGAQHSENTSFSVKILFWLGYLIWALTGKYIAPGCVIIAKRI